MCLPDGPLLALAAVVFAVGAVAGYVIRGECGS